MDDGQVRITKRILVVDDEADILETLEELLDEYDVDTADSFEDAVGLLKTKAYDAAVLDIMGVRGYDLLEITHRLNIPTLMLTAHALTPDNLRTSIEKGADAYVPKDQIFDIALFVADVLAARKQGKQANASWYSFVNPLFDKLFGEGWRKTDQEFWDEFEAKQTENGNR